MVDLENPGWQRKLRSASRRPCSSRLLNKIAMSISNSPSSPHEACLIPTTLIYRTYSYSTKVFGRVRILPPGDVLLTGHFICFPVCSNIQVPCTVLVMGTSFFISRHEGHTQAEEETYSQIKMRWPQGLPLRPSRGFAGQGLLSNTSTTGAQRNTDTYIILDQSLFLICCTYCWNIT